MVTITTTYKIFYPNGNNGIIANNYNNPFKYNNVELNVRFHPSTNSILIKWHWDQYHNAEKVQGC